MRPRQLFAARYVRLAHAHFRLRIANDNNRNSIVIGGYRAPRRGDRSVLVERERRVARDRVAVGRSRLSQLIAARRKAHDLVRLIARLPLHVFSVQLHDIILAVQQLYRRAGKLRDATGRSLTDLETGAAVLNGIDAVIVSRQAVLRIGLDHRRDAPGPGGDKGIVHQSLRRDAGHHIHGPGTRGHIARLGRLRQREGLFHDVRAQVVRRNGQRQQTIVIRAACRHGIARRVCQRKDDRIDGAAVRGVHLAELQLDGIHVNVRLFVVYVLRGDFHGLADIVFAQRYLHAREGIVSIRGLVARDGGRTRLRDHVAAQRQLFIGGRGLAGADGQGRHSFGLAIRGNCKGIFVVGIQRLAFAVHNGLGDADPGRLAGIAVFEFKRGLLARGHSQRGVIAFLVVHGGRHHIFDAGLRLQGIRDGLRAILRHLVAMPINDAVRLGEQPDAVCAVHGHLIIIDGNRLKVGALGGILDHKANFAGIQLAVVAIQPGDGLADAQGRLPGLVGHGEFAVAAGDLGIIALDLVLNDAIFNFILAVVLGQLGELVFQLFAGELQRLARHILPFAIRLSLQLNGDGIHARGPAGGQAPAVCPQLGDLHLGLGGAIGVFKAQKGHAVVGQHEFSGLAVAAGLAHRVAGGEQLIALHGGVRLRDGIRLARRQQIVRRRQLDGIGIRALSAVLLVVHHVLKGQLKGLLQTGAGHREGDILHQRLHLRLGKRLQAREGLGDLQANGLVVHAQIAADGILVGIPVGFVLVQLEIEGVVVLVVHIARQMRILFHQLVQGAVLGIQHAALILRREVNQRFAVLQRPAPRRLAAF